MALRVPGKGLPSKEAGGISGDLFVIVRTRPDPRFERAGPNLWRSEVVAAPDAALGTSLEVPTIERSTKVKVPPGTQPDTVLRLRGHGLPEFGATRRGDLFVRIQVQVPERLSSEERELYERLRASAGSRGRARAGTP